MVAACDRDRGPLIPETQIRIVDVERGTLFYRRIGTYDWEVHQNERIHQRLFGTDYVSPQPAGLV